MLAPALTKLCNLSQCHACEAPLGAIYKEKQRSSWGHTREGHDPHWTSVFLNGDLQDPKIGCNRLVWEGAKKYNFHFCYAQYL